MAVQRRAANRKSSPSSSPSEKENKRGNRHASDNQSSTLRRAVLEPISLDIRSEAEKEKINEPTNSASFLLPAVSTCGSPTPWKLYRHPINTAALFYFTSVSVDTGPIESHTRRWRFRAHRNHFKKSSWVHYYSCLSCYFLRVVILPRRIEPYVHHFAIVFFCVISLTNTAEEMKLRHLCTIRCFFAFSGTNHILTS